jgi:hypothetical protein
MMKLPLQVLCCDAVGTGAEMATTIKAIEGETSDYSELGGEEWEWYCDLERNHFGSHVAHVQRTPLGQEWWLRWGDGVVILVSEPGCEGEDEGSDDAEGKTYCLLPANHRGPHTNGRMHWLTA